MTALRRALTAFVAAGLVGLSACGATSPDATAHDDADVAFATSMLPHHEQAVTMSDLLLAKDGVDPDVSALARTIKAEQQPEITQMTGWLQEWAAPVPSMGDMSGMGAHDGMLSTEQLDALSAATGKEAQTRFLKGMIGHHQGAVAMAQTEVASGQDGRAKALATSIVTSQQAEIEQMQHLLGS